MSDGERDEHIAEASMERSDRNDLIRRLRRQPKRVWRNATHDAARSERLNFEYQEQIEAHRRREEYAE